MPVSNSKRKKMKKVVLTKADRQRIEAAFYRKAEEYMKLDLPALQEMNRKGLNEEGFKITGISWKALTQVIIQKQQLASKIA